MQRGAGHFTQARCIVLPLANPRDLIGHVQRETLIDYFLNFSITTYRKYTEQDYRSSQQRQNPWVIPDVAPKIFFVWS